MLKNKIFALFLQNESNSDGRMRKAPDRLGTRQPNRDDYFENDDLLDEEFDDSMKSSKPEQQSKESAPFSANELSNTNVSMAQMARMESKLNIIQKTMFQIYRTITLFGRTSEAHLSLNECDTESSNLPELPLQTVLLLDKFEEDLNTATYRKKIVSITFVLFVVSSKLSESSMAYN